MFRKKPIFNRTNTNTGGLIEEIKAKEWIILKELGKMSL